jgi:hypothetical protein
MTNGQTAERTAAIERLRQWLTPGQTVYTILCSRSASGMSRKVRIVLVNARGDVSQPTHLVAVALGRTPIDREGHWMIDVRGAGFDAGHSLVQDLARTVFGIETDLRHEWL